jgi:hypothetical protein
LGQAAEELDPAAGCESIHSVGDEIRGVGIDRGQVDVVPFGDVTIIPQYMRVDACIVVRCLASEVRSGWAHGRATNEIWKTNPEVGASPGSLA